MKNKYFFFKQKKYLFEDLTINIFLKFEVTEWVMLIEVPTETLWGFKWGLFPNGRQLNYL